MKSLFLGNAPCGYHKYKYPRDADVFGAKVNAFNSYIILITLYKPSQQIYQNLHSV